MTKTIDLTGKRFGRYTVLSRHPENSKAQKARFICVCDCGNERIVVAGNLQSGISTSCGCRKAEVSGARFRTHGLSKNSMMFRWWGMMARCYNPNSLEYHNYGGRGIQVCERWRMSPQAFIDDMGKPPFPDASIDRKDNSGNYSPENCRWATAKEQTLNRRVTRFISFNGETLCVRDWSRRLGMKDSAVPNRLRKGWSIEKALTTPPIPKGQYERKRAA